MCDVLRGKEFVAELKALKAEPWLPCFTAPCFLLRIALVNVPRRGFIPLAISIVVGWLRRTSDAASAAVNARFWVLCCAASALRDCELRSWLRTKPSSSAPLALRWCRRSPRHLGEVGLDVSPPYHRAIGSVQSGVRGRGVRILTWPPRGLRSKRRWPSSADISSLIDITH